MVGRRFSNHRITMDSQDHHELGQFLEEAFALQEKGHSYTSIRSHFKEKGLDDETIGYLIRLIDEFVIEEEKIEANIKSQRFRILFGILVMLIGLLISYLFYVNESLQGIYLVLAVIPLASGLGIIWTSYRQLLEWRNHQPEIDDSKLKLIRRIK